MTSINLDTAYRPSEDIVAREIEGEVIIVPLVAGMGDLNDDLFSLNATGQDIWQRLDGTRSVRQIIDDLAAAYGVTAEEITPHVCGFLQELRQRGIIAEELSA